MNNLFHTLRSWSFDKQLTLIFPTVILFTGLLSGTIFEMQPNENKAALVAGAIYILLTVAMQPFLKRKSFSDNTEWFLRELWPILAILLGYLTMRLFRLELAIESFGIQQQDELMIQIDNLLFGQTIPLYLQHWISPFFTLLMESAYLHFYYLLPIGSLIYFYWSDQRDVFLRLRKGIIFTLTGGFCLYFALPVVGPISYIADQFVVPLKAGHEIVYDAVNSFRFAYDCFPSLHTAIPWMTLFLTWSLHKHWIRYVMLFMTLAITFSTMYLRYHYGTDVIAGFVWAYLVAYGIKYYESKLSQRAVISPC